MDRSVRPFRFLHTSDWQLGMSRWFLDKEAPVFDSDRLDAIRSLAAYAKEQECECIVVAGDVFETNNPSETTIGRVEKLLKQIDISIFLLPGNHDPLTQVSALRMIQDAQIDGVHVICDEQPFSLRPGVEIIGAPLMVKHPDHDLVCAVLSTLEPKKNPTDVRILVGHGQLDSYGEDNLALIDADRVRHALENNYIDYLALGDTHSTRELMPGVWFSGSPETTDFFEHSTGGGESDSGNILIVEVDPSADACRRITVTPHKIGKWIFDAYSWTINSVEDVRFAIADVEKYEDPSKVVIKYAVSGVADLETVQLFEQEIARLKFIFASLKERKHSPGILVEPSMEDIENMNLPGYMRQAVADLVDKKETEALKLLFALQGQRS